MNIKRQIRQVYGQFIDGTPKTDIHLHYGFAEFELAIGLNFSDF